MICEKCQFQDPLGQFTKCPVCEEGSEQLCGMLNHQKGFCRLDGRKCPLHESNQYENCPKLDADNNPNGGSPKGEDSSAGYSLGD